MATTVASAGALWKGFQDKQDDSIYMRNVVSGLSGVMLVFTCAFFMCACVAATIQNAGFNVVLTGTLLFAWEIGTVWLMGKGPRPLSHGFLIGVSLVMFFLVIMTAIYWGQLANCDASYDGDYSHYSCNHKAAIRGVAAFASIIWIFQIPFTLVIIRYRGTITRDSEIGDNGRDGFGYNESYDNWSSSAGGGGPGTTLQGAGGGITSDL
ncbi:unnamed protein product [Discosporangium mesarthrocarpum]